MGHDVIAFKGSTEDLNQMVMTELAKRIESGELGDFEDFRKQITEKAIASKMRRSSFDRFNKIIYMLCGAEAWYGGFSGDNGAVWMTEEDIDHALARLDHMRETGIPALCVEEIEGLKERLIDAAGKDYDTGVTFNVLNIDPKTGERTELTGKERQEHLQRMAKEDGDWGKTEEDNLETERQFLSDIKTYLHEENADRVRIWFG